VRVCVFLCGGGGGDVIENEGVGVGVGVVENKVVGVTVGVGRAGVVVRVRVGVRAHTVS